MGIVETIKKEAQEVGREEGREVGREEGREVGREEGREEGMEELKIRLVKSFLVDKGFSISETASLLGLTEYFVRKVKGGL
ncbi:MAG TPA: hypothetical protein VL053_19520 [Arachidicoccus sp.]|nr:hypothetical protein [Arachidicoccus sp.]